MVKSVSRPSYCTGSLLVRPRIVRITRIVRVVCIAIRVACMAVRLMRIPVRDGM